MTVLPEEFVEQLARIMKLVRTQRTLPTQLEAAVALTKRTVPTCDAAGVSLVLTDEPMTAAATDRVVLEVDLVQYSTEQGPCLDAMAGGNVVRVDLVEREIRYSRFAPGAIDAGVNSIMSFPLLASGRSVGALNLYSYQPNAFDEETERRMAPIVSYTADVLTASPLYAYSLDMVEGLVQTVEERAVIDQATGALVSRNQWPSSDAFEFLRDRALVQGQTLVEAARAVLERGFPKDAG